MSREEKLASFSSTIEPITQSRFLLAKYRIQVVDPEKMMEHNLKTTDSVNIGELLQKTSHYHAGPDAIEYNKNERRCTKDKLMQILWCFLLPCIALSQCFSSCSNYLCDLGSEITTHLEERYTLRCCLCCECCKLTI